MIIGSVEFDEIEFNLEILRVDKSYRKSLMIDDIKTCRGTKTKAIDINKIKTVKSKKSTSGVKVDNISTNKENKVSSSMGLKPLILARPRTNSKNSFLACTTNKTYNEHIEVNEKNQKLLLNSHPYIAIKGGILTKAEKKLYDFLYENLGIEVTILAKVRLADVVEVNKQVTRDMKHLYKIACKHIDFLACDKNTLDIICAIELDDYTHETLESKERDQFIGEVLHECNIELFRIKCKIASIETEDLNGINRCIYEYYLEREQ